MEFNCIFTPRKRRPYKSIAYLKCSGLEARIPLKLSGLGLGPYVLLNIESLDAGNIFVCAVHQYEVVALNKGDIPARVAYKCKKLDYGGTIQCQPEYRNLRPGECGSFVLEFSTKNKGKFMEELNFEVINSGEILKFYMK